ncbi:pre-mRNA-splicing factor cwc24 [Paracoccidioides lutzii Pb01]|uniref:Pre-mRNA-splicing factor CWC24 n=1 Tax=Paracoccidioides lutzii (strain ATCC MYA-826 / Pb01) TaxID=502779 RepID=C1H211_PARBA|nr:pre-mRNA-splicing factor cwc24 [Paracoccidioides lutzii Pb01]EEH33898.1 pre-mRNA-splicing factor cwc24 [Paracoccidioides lutzii Pb01]
MGEAQTVETTPQISFKKRSAKAKSSSFRKRAPSPPAPASDSASDYSTSDEEGGRTIKRRRKNATVTASSANSTIAQRQRAVIDDSSTSTSAAPLPIPQTNDATKHSNWFDDDAGGKDGELSARNLLGNTRKNQGNSAPATSTSAVDAAHVATSTSTPSNLPDGTYRGSANYQSFLQKNPNATHKQFGPIKAPTNIRTITITDYSPDVCKDYKQTGFCGFGDGCKFLHAREDYKAGWELDRDWEIGTRGKKVVGRTVASRDSKAGGSGDQGEGEDEDDELLENIPFACVICKQPYKTPIVTRCGHYFCEGCALQRYRKNPSCAACGSGTGGVFNTAKKLSRLLERKRERIRKRKEKAREEGEEVSEDEDEEEGVAAGDESAGE